ncbi:hypothetical protein D3C78_938920 [compost metagenome]
MNVIRIGFKQTLQPFTPFFITPLPDKRVNFIVHAVVLLIVFDRYRLKIYLERETTVFTFTAEDQQCGINLLNDCHIVGLHKALETGTPRSGRTGQQAFVTQRAKQQPA